jgi:1-deoxy-D-xylulose-5-phosphate reductoisomerase
MARLLTILGATGSIGVNTLSVVRANPTLFKVFALTAHRQIDTLAKLAQEFKPRYVVVSQVAQINEIAALLPPETKVLCGSLGLVEVAEKADVVVAGIVGADGLIPVYRAALAGKVILLANKEALVVGGRIFMEAVVQHKATLIPLDSEHNAIFQSAPLQLQRAEKTTSVLSVILTASGGPFLHTPIADLSHVTVEQACKHPNWNMGQKISVDSATMMNKALEMIEAGYLFGLSEQQIEVVIHPQSIVHSLVRYRDGSLLAQMGTSDMRIPIAHALAYPERIDSGALQLDLTVLKTLNFLPVDLERFPAIGLARTVMNMGHWASVVLNAANEEAVAAFLQKKIVFTDIFPVVEEMLSCMSARDLSSLEEIQAYDSEVRVQARHCLNVQFS